MRERRTYDVAVVGLGGLGSATLWHLARRAARVAELLELVGLSDLNGARLAVAAGRVAGRPVASTDLDEMLESAADALASGKRSGSGRLVLAA